MGFRRKGGRSKGSNSAGKKRPDSTYGDKPKQGERLDYPNIEKHNQAFYDYYKKQGILSDEEFKQFYEVLGTPLPTTFRITGSRETALELREQIKNRYVPSLENVEIEGDIIKPPQPLEWYPDDLGWHYKVSRGVLRKSPDINAFHKFIVAETEIGNISRQEAVSMIPPLLLKVKPHQWVLDMCAAPGSKTAQIIEAVHANDRQNEIPTGLVIANDADYKRSHMLVHQCRRLASPCFVATHHDATHFPNIHLKDDNGRVYKMQFDRVLCDVPCSGDGTFRKNETIWRNWGIGGGIGLHPTQVQIFLRGAQLTKVGGRIVYSTCSFNPIENEAVVAEVLNLSNGALQLQDVSNELVGLKRKPGMKTWKVMTKEGQWIDSQEDIPEHRKRSRYPRSMFPPANVDELPLERCVRIYPHEQDTGGFFVAVFEKVAPMTGADTAYMAHMKGDTIVKEDELIESEKKEEELLENVGPKEDESSTAPATPEVKEDVEVPSKRAAAEGEETAAKPNKKAKESEGLKEAPFELMSPDSEDVVEATEFYGLASNFPKTQFLLRSMEGNSRNRTIYFVSESVKTILSQPAAKRLRLVNTGVKVFVRQGSPMDGGCPLRISSDGLSLISPYVSEKRCFDLSTDELRAVVTKAFPLIEEFDEQSRERLTALEPGCCIFRYDTSKLSDSKQRGLWLPLTLPVWKARVSFNLLLNKKEKKSLSLRLFDVEPEHAPAELQNKQMANMNKSDEASSV
ncbi:S-adenosyl-L-methionine-dependent methyltransferase [Umbelopsis sp. AD052]|nr:S-adenosyl-L-methionine-dependent methyltransferase [Umbelopsis sp. AD052]